MFIPGVMVIKMSKMAYLLYFLLMTGKLVAVWAKYSSKPEKFSWVLSKNGMVNKLWIYCSWSFEGRNIKKNCWISKKITCIFKGWHLANGSSKSNNPWHFLKGLNKIFCIWRTSTLNSIAPSPLWSVKYTFTCQRWDFKLVNIDVLFIQKSC